MDPVMLRAALRRAPFCPFRLVTDDGSSHEVRARDQAMVTSTEIAIAQEEHGEDMPRCILMVALSTIARIEWLAACTEPAHPPLGVNKVEPAVNPEILQELLRAVPFRPFRVCVSDGSQHDVRHPELMYVTHRWIAVALRADRRGIPRETVFLNPLHITRVEPLPDDDSGSREAV